MHKLDKSIFKVERGDNSGLREIYDQLGHAIYTQSYFITKDHHLAEDVSQEVFIKIMICAPSYTRGTNPKAWIMSIARNTAIDKLRKKDMNDLSFSKDTEYCETKLAKVGVKIDLDEKIDLIEEINKLDFQSQQIVLLHVIVGLKFREISSLLDMPQGTVAWKYKLIIKELKLKLSR
ncbi:RNA polymerase sigma factor [Ruminiclostridium papyrosolvens]|uniref:RNA polymerase sigma factor n=1 Tax=Ruminiclostridium papyrosolvens C7 TaxID=1330534 RepID=U4QWG2_9FIRM|nr:RNA polymerase sigma factor [Ruminiclostridium papyrosolvens]EPR07489.1 hypothetical protein L323_20335 [Ruminiclostridium papyrosolvens C7]